MCEMPPPPLRVLGKACTSCPASSLFGRWRLGPASSRENGRRAGAGRVPRTVWCAPRWPAAARSMARASSKAKGGGVQHCRLPRGIATGGRTLPVPELLNTRCGFGHTVRCMESLCAPEGGVGGGRAYGLDMRGWAPFLSGRRRPEPSHPGRPCRRVPQCVRRRGADGRPHASRPHGPRPAPDPTSHAIPPPPPVPHPPDSPTLGQGPMAIVGNLVGQKGSPNSAPAVFLFTPCILLPGPWA